MRICDLNTGTMLLTQSAKRLREQWELTRPFWHDQNALDFERELLQPLAPQLTLTLSVVNRLAHLMEQVERDCSDEEQP